MPNSSTATGTTVSLTTSLSGWRSSLCALGMQLVVSRTQDINIILFMGSSSPSPGRPLRVRRRPSGPSDTLGVARLPLSSLQGSEPPDSETTYQ